MTMGWPNLGAPSKYAIDHQQRRFWFVMDFSRDVFHDFRVTRPMVAATYEREAGRAAHREGLILGDVVDHDVTYWRVGGTQPHPYPDDADGVRVTAIWRIAGVVSDHVEGVTGSPRVALVADFTQYTAPATDGPTTPEPTP